MAFLYLRRIICKDSQEELSDVSVGLEQCTEDLGLRTSDIPHAFFFPVEKHFSVSRKKREHIRFRKTFESWQTANINEADMNSNQSQSNTLFF